MRDMNESLTHQHGQQDGRANNPPVLHVNILHPASDQQQEIKYITVNEQMWPTCVHLIDSTHTK